MDIIASVVIPTFKRQKSTERAIQSVLSQKSSDKVEIIVVDDCPTSKFVPDSLRKQDTLIQNESNKGAAYARNVGIRAAKGPLIYLLDSDDYFVSRDYYADLSASKYNTLYYCELRSQNYESKYPQKIELENFFDAIFYQYPYILQTSSLMFLKSPSFFFDETLPRHQDWDFVYSNFLSKNLEIAKSPGVVFFDRSDQSSISRSSNSEKSKFWFIKLKHSGAALDFDYIHYNIFGRTAAVPWTRFISDSIKYLITGKIKPSTIAKMIVRRFIYYVSKFKV